MTKSTSKLWALLTVMVAVLVGLAMAPLSHGQAMQSSQNQSGQSISATGCLQRSSSGSGYQLTDQASNKTYDLTASSSDVDLSAHVGHTVTVTGTTSGASGESSSSAASNPSSSSASGTGASGTGTTGTGSSGTSTSGTSTGSTTPAQTITVTNVKLVSSSCQQ